MDPQKVFASGLCWWFRKGLGLLRTFNTQWHNEVPDLSQITSQNMPLQDKLAALQNLTFLQEKFRQYKVTQGTTQEKPGFIIEHD